MMAFPLYTLIARRKRALSELAALGVDPQPARTNKDKVQPVMAIKLRVDAGPKGSRFFGGEYVLDWPSAM